MVVKLIQYTLIADKICGLAALGCHTEKAAFELADETTESKIRNILQITFDKGHESIIEHASFTFSIKGVSRTLTHQLVRHRIASYSQQSQRYVRISNPEYVTPETIRNSNVYLGEYDDLMQQIWKLYDAMVDNGIPAEDARFVLPNSCKTNIVVTMNARELHHFFKLRCCEKAQWEIRDLACKMLELAKEKAPIIFEKAGPECESCPEKDEECQQRHIGIFSSK